MSASTQRAASTSARPRQLIACRVKVTTEQGEKHSYTALCKNTASAVMDAIDRFGFCKVSAEVQK